MKKEVVIASAIAGLLTSLSAGDNPTINIDKVSIDKAGKVLAPKKIEKNIKKKGIIKEIEKRGSFGFGCNDSCDGDKKIPNRKDRAPILKR